MEPLPPNFPAEPFTTSASLEGTEWRLTDYLGPEGELVPVPEDVTASATFADGVVFGSTGCNRYRGACHAADNRLSIPPVAMTMMACDPIPTAVEQAFTAALEAAATYAISVETLDLADADGRVSLRFRVARAPNLVGTRWVATAINNGRGGVVGALEATEVDAVFGDGGQIAGSGGCNRFSGPYAVEGADLAIGPLAATRKACLAPEGVGEQEAWYFAALARVGTWSFQDDRLQLRSADGALQVEYREAPGT